jgi:hypothetical protein
MAPPSTGADSAGLSADVEGGAYMRRSRPRDDRAGECGSPIHTERMSAGRAPLTGSSIDSATGSSGSSVV